MPKLASMTPRKLIQKLKRLGFVIDHTAGSHIVMYHSSTKRRAVVPFHLNDIKKGTLSSLLRESGITKEEILQV